MKLCVALGVLCLAAGCASSQPRAESTAAVEPMHDELPDLVAREDRQTSFRSGVLATGVRPSRQRIVPKFEPIPLTDAEREALDEPEEEDDFDLLAFYKPARSAAQGVLPFDHRPAAHYYLPARTTSGVVAPGSIAGSFFETTGRFRAGSFGRSTAGAYSERTIRTSSFTEGSATIGTGETRSISNRAHSVDY